MLDETEYALEICAEIGSDLADNGVHLGGTAWHARAEGSAVLCDGCAEDHAAGPPWQGPPCLEDD